MSSRKIIKRAEHHVLNFTFPFLQKTGRQPCDLNPFSWSDTELLVIYCVSVARSGLHHTSLHSRVVGEGNGNPLQYPCLENPMDRGAWQAAVLGVTKSQAQLSNWHSRVIISELLFVRCSVMSDSLWTHDCSTPGFPVPHCLLEFAETHIYGVSDAVQPSHPLSPPSSLTLSLSQHQCLFQWVGSSYQVAKLLEIQH